MRTIQKVLVHTKTGKRFLVKSIEDDFHTSFGTISCADMKSDKEMVESSKKEKFIVLEPSFVDLLAEMQRGPQVITAKDIGWIIAKTGVNGMSRVVDAGGGSGALCFSLANICKEVFVYEVNSEHFTILEKNKKLFGFANVTLKKESVYTGLTERDVDVVTLDLAEPWKALTSVEKALKTGGFLVVYLPNMLQVKDFIDALRGSRIRLLEMVEVLERQWKVEEKILRPEFEMLGHTGFLLLGRKM
ncbi:MAG: hypothetical protein A2912_01145 [Candidatus Buchananbacteria bacterium RIFCSPLOWO2_01_FULL_40_23b]|uniref:tRNA (adenine(58)-N(1))-methyltransferase TrmI n=1 Tax=Candidatus Buchananbacteria bacterium RIFCSPLOWO2_01_FULL_40_23b TaxID=1797544 RepID=A0A1G1YW62_9BACT|nr:MAG: hypothetical protein A2912_01145 [Candidatus Buchananbacteria bacterium RIFCSPLOWO2_01_FULL_40_23b]